MTDKHYKKYELTGGHIKNNDNSIKGVKSDIRISLLCMILILSLVLGSCSLFKKNDSEEPEKNQVQEEEVQEEEEQESESEPEVSDGPIDPDDVPEYSGEPSVEINGNIPSFAEELNDSSDDDAAEDTDSEVASAADTDDSGTVSINADVDWEEIVSDPEDSEFEEFKELDVSGRCGEADALIGKDMMPDGERGSIGMIKPSGWQLAKYDFVDGKYLFNRCHLIGWQLTGQNDEVRNLITGTRYLNVKGMLPYENEVADYIEETENHVMYVVTPIFKDEELIARGVQIEAMSIEDGGEGVEFNVYCYNVQPGVEIDYETGENEYDEEDFDKWGDTVYGIYAVGSEKIGESGTRESSASSNNAKSDSTKNESASKSNSDKKNVKSTGNSGKKSSKAKEKASSKSKNSKPGKKSGSNKKSSSSRKKSKKVNNSGGSGYKQTYILNGNTMKFHYPGCRSVTAMNPANRVEFYGTRKEIMSRGYDPCGNCNP